MSSNIKEVVKEFKQQDFAFYMACLYIILSYVRPQLIYPSLNILPWNQLVIMMGIMYLISKGRLKFDEILYYLFLFAIAALLSAVFSEYKDVSFRSIEVPFIWFVEVLFVINAIKNRTQFKLMLIILFLSLLKMAIFGAKTWVSRGFGFTGWGIAGPPGFFSNSGEFSLLMAIFVVLAIPILSAGGRNWSWVYWMAPLSGIMTVLGASSRGGQLALLFGLVYLSVFYWKIRLRNLFYLILLVSSTIMLMPDRQMERFRSMGEDRTSISRLLYWSKGIEMLGNYPVLGVGYKAFPVYFNDHYWYEKEDNDKVVKKAEVSHNSFIEVGSQLGSVGLILYALILITTWRAVRYTRMILKSCVTEHDWLYKLTFSISAALIVYLVGSFFMSVAFYPYIYLIIMLSVVMKRVAIKGCK